MRLDEYRKEKQLSQRQFGELLDPPASPSLVSQWECGTTRVTLDYAHEIQLKTSNEVTTEDCAAMFSDARQRQKASV
jgi:transcriptional regulator with XRE-family HTH domain